MAIGIQNFPNIIPSDSDYLSGRIKDDSGANDGTPIDQLTNGDIQEFFAKMMKLASITPNGVFDNEYSGHQYIQGLIQQIFNRGSSPIIQGLIGTYTANDLIILSGSIVLSNSNNTATWTDMAIYYNGNTYLVAAGTSTKSSGVFLFTISDAVSFMITIAHGTSGTGIADYGATTVKNLRGDWFHPASSSTWGNSGSYCRKTIFGEIELSGYILGNGTPPSTGIAGILPVGFRPLSSQFFAVSGQINSVVAIYALRIDPDGTINFLNADRTTPSVFGTDCQVSLSGIRFSTDI